MATYPPPSCEGTRCRECAGRWHLRRHSRCCDPRYQYHDFCECCEEDYSCNDSLCGPTIVFPILSVIGTVGAIACGIGIALFFFMRRRRAQRAVRVLPDSDGVVVGQPLPPQAAMPVLYPPSVSPEGYLLHPVFQYDGRPLYPVAC
eukprot:Rhum_TRINITY_DN19301_c0_g1::Rhum_TRINITY_DN19301_c0_g1_i1::g.169746::m.169746